MVERRGPGGGSLNECRPLYGGTLGDKVKIKKQNGDHCMVERREGN